MTSSTDPSPEDNMGSTDRENDSAGEPSDSSATSALARAMRDVGPYLDLGWRLAASAAFPPLLGLLLDLWLGTLPWGLLIGSVLGLSAAVLQLSGIKRDFK